MNRRLPLSAVLALLVLASACASKPVKDPGGKWANQAAAIDNSLFQ